MSDANEDLAADGLWSRFRDVAMGLRRLQDFNFAAEGAEAGFTDRWLERLVKDDAARASAGRELVLRAFRAGADTINFQVLTHLRDEEAMPLSELARITGLPHFTLSERVNDLVQVGLAARVLEQDAVRATPLTRGLLGIVGEIEGRLATAMRERLPGLLGR